MKMMPLASPSTPPGLPYGLQRGGIMDAPWVPPTYIDARFPTVPTDSPSTYVVGEDIFRTPVGFRSSQTVRVVTGPPPGTRPMAGYGQMIPARGEFMESADVPPLAIPGWHPPALPGGMTQGGIFGMRPVQNGYAPQRVPWQRPPLARRDVIYAPPVSGYGGCGCAGPDGLGGW